MNARNDGGYWIVTAGIPLVVVLVTLSIALRIIARRTGSPAVTKWFIPLAFIAVLCILGQASYDQLSGTAQRWVSISFCLLMSLLFWGVLIHSAWRQRLAGGLLLDLGPPEPYRRRIGFVFTVVFGFMAVWSGVGWAGTGFRAPDCLSATVMWATFTLFCLVILRNRLRITERGIVAFGGLVEWERVLGHEWIGEGSERLLLRVRQQIPLLGARTGLLILPVPPPDRGALEGILARHASLTRSN